MPLRTDTVQTGKPIAELDFNKQNLIGILGIRGSGKSWLGESLLMKYFNAGYTVLDLWSAPNLENCYWIFAKEGHKKRIPITILAPESFILPRFEVDKFNEKFTHSRQPLVKFVKLVTPTKKTDTEQNEKILDTLIHTVIECREKRRILVFNPYMFPNESEMFRVLEILMRNLVTISNNYFDKIQPESIGKTSESQLTQQEKNHHKLAFLIREFGEVAPARLKGDKSGESTLIKKALLKFVRVSRHYNIDGIIDYQNASDVDSSIRNQINLWMIKTWTPELAGESFDYVFNQVNGIRKGILESDGFTNESMLYANHNFPPIERMTQKYYYFIKRGQTPILREVPQLNIKHKEPSDKWWLITGIPIKWDKELIERIANSNNSAIGKSTKSVDKLAYFTIKDLKDKMKGKQGIWDDVCKNAGLLQKNGELHHHLDFSTTKSNTIQKWFGRMKKEHDSE